MSGRAPLWAFAIPVDGETEATLAALVAGHRGSDADVLADVLAIGFEAAYRETHHPRQFPGAAPWHTRAEIDAELLRVGRKLLTQHPGYHR